MPIEQEIELKILIDVHTFDYLKSVFQNNLTLISQKNFYYDTPNGTLHKCNQALRIRQTNNQSVVTLKTKVDTLTSQEITVPLETDLFSTITKKPDLIAAIHCNHNQLSEITHFTTTRYFSTLPFGTLFLDFTQYKNKHSDYEIEIELLNSALLPQALEWLELYSIEYKMALPKIARALASQ